VPTLVLAQAAPNELLNFQFNPYGQPPRAHFQFQRPPRILQQSAVAEGRPELVLECPNTRNTATRANYLRHYPEPYPLAILDVTQWEDAQGPVVVIRLGLREGVRPLVESPANEPYVHVTLLEAGAVEGASSAAPPDTGAADDAAPSRGWLTTSVGGIVLRGGLALGLATALGGGVYILTRRRRGGGRVPQYRVLSASAALQASRDASEVLERFRASAEVAVHQATAQHRLVTEAIRRDTVGLRDALSGLAREFERAAHSAVLLHGPSRALSSPAEPSPDRRASPSAQDVAAPAPDPQPTTDARRRFVQDWVVRVAARLDEGGAENAHTDAITQRARPVTGRAAPPACEGPPGPPASEVAAPTEVESSYDRARREIAEGRTPLEVAQKTGLSMGEVELIAQLQRMRQRRSAGGTVE
jgi:hypothetical protein